jgi:hypothetical protein
MDRPVEFFKQRIMDVVQKKGSIYSTVGLATCCIVPSDGLQSLEEEDRFQQAINELLSEGMIGKKTLGMHTFYCLPC